VFGASSGEPAQDLFGLGGAEARGGGVLDELVVLVFDQLPADGAGQHILETRVGRLSGSVVIGRPVGAVEAYPTDVLQARQQPEAEQVREGEAHDRGAVGVDVVAVDLRAGQMPEEALYHGCYLRGRTAL
jgi:hypothetical protein